MPFCCQCGKPTQDTDVFCGACGARQPVNPLRPGGISPRTASILCYIPVLGWIPAIIVLASQRFRRDATVRFHAFQGIYLFVAYLIVDWVVGPMTGFTAFRGIHHPWFSGPGFVAGGLLRLLIWILWIFMLVKTSQGQTYKLPLLGELADRSVAEQR